MQHLIGNAFKSAYEAAAEAVQPPRPVDYVAWAESSVVFSGRESPFPGPYSRALFPHFDEPLRALADEDPCQTVTLMCSAQVGKTTIGNVFVGGSLDMDPGDLLVVHPTEDNARRWSKLKLAALLKSTTALARAFPQKSRDGTDSVLFKERTDGRGSILISGANSPSSLSQVSMRRQMQDDLSKWEMNSAGDPEGQADSRSQAFQFRKVLKAGTPLVMPGCRTTTNFKAGSQEVYEVPCPHEGCGAFQVLEWENMEALLDPSRPEDAHFSCVSCGAEIRQTDRGEMLRAGRWVARQPQLKRIHRSFWLWGAYSPLQSWEDIARAWLSAKGDPAREQVFYNDKLGRAWEAQGEAPPWEKLRDRAQESPYTRGQIPVGALVYTIGVDCQQDRVEWQLVGWGGNLSRWVLDYGVFPGHIGEPSTQALLDGLLNQTWINAHGRRFPADMVAIDGNAWTEDVWGWVRKHSANRVMMVRGVASETASLLARVKKERRRDGKLLRYSRRFYNFATSVLKMALYRQLMKTDPLEAGYVGLPRGLEDEYFRQLTAERRKGAKNRKGFMVYAWVKDPGQANEGLDTHLQAEAAAIRFGIRSFQDVHWTRLADERERAPDPVSMQTDLEDLLATPAVLARPPAPTAPETAPAVGAPDGAVSPGAASAPKPGFAKAVRKLSM